jgi:methionyl-tRNA formyltransferase
MRYIFFGTPDFAATVLHALVDAGHAPVLLVCNPDRPVGRKHAITAPPTKQLVANNKWPIAILQPEHLETTFIEELSALKPDVLVVAAYAKIIPHAVLRIPRLGTLGVHPSLLPRLRGASPIQSAILVAEPETGVTLYLMDEKMDHGPIVIARKLADYDPANETYASLAPRLARLAGELVGEVMARSREGAIHGEPQNHAQATFTQKFKTEDGYVPEADLILAQSGSVEHAERINRLIRALNPEPGVWTVQREKRVKLLEATLLDGRLKLDLIQVEGKKPQKPLPL